MVVKLPTLDQVQQFLAGLPPEEVVILLLILALPLAMVNFICKTILTVLFRIFGLAHPTQYRLFLCLPWRPFYAVYVGLSLWLEHISKFGKQATGGFAGTLTQCLLRYQPGMVFIGRATMAGLGTMVPVGLKVTRHLFCYAMTGGGKTTWVISMLQCWRGSAWLIDPKGIVTAILARCDWRQWVVLAPYEPAISAQWNPFDDLKAAIARSEDAVKWSMRIAEALITTPSGTKSPFFYDTPRGFVSSLLLHVLSFHEEKDHHLPFVRDLILQGYQVADDEGNVETSPEEARALLYKFMRENPAFNGAVAGGAVAFEEASGEVEGNLLATLIEQTKWLDIPSVRDMLLFTSMPLSVLKTRNDVVLSFVAPVLSIREELQPLVRLLTNMTAYTFESIKKKRGQCLTIVDELQAQGYNKTLEVVLPVGRSYGQIFVGIAQDMEGMKNAYPNTYQGFTGNADAVLWLGSNHQSNLQHLSTVMGKRTIKKRDRRTKQTTDYSQAVMNEEQLARLLDPDRGYVVITRAGKRPLLLKNDPYFRALPVWAYDPDPDHREPILRATMRFLLNRKPRRQ